MQEVERVRDYRFRAVIKTNVKSDHAIKIDARKIALRNRIGMTNGLHYLDLDQIRLEFGEDLIMEWWRSLMYMLPIERVKEAIREYVEKSLRRL